jgi:hypothetical protein
VKAAPYEADEALRRLAPMIADRYRLHNTVTIRNDASRDLLPTGTGEAAG